MADQSTPLILEALTKALAEPGGAPLHGNKKTPGLFPAGARAKQAAQLCLEQGYLRVLHRETKGRTVQEVCALTEKGSAYLLRQVSPKPVLEELVRTLQARQAQVDELVAAIHQWQAGLNSLQNTVEKVLQQATEKEDGSRLNECLAADLMASLTEWQASGASGDCSLPEWYRRVSDATPSLTIGHFHDNLRRLHEVEKIYLHPWTGPLYEIPEPAFGLLVGHEIAYYASIRQQSKMAG
jgi:DNA-binding PadR family transcriptional regulator